MKIFFLLLFPFFASANTYYVATTGSDNNAGTQASPFASWQKLASVLKAGDIAYIRGGTYRSLRPIGVGNYPVDWRNLNGTAAAHITVSAYPGESPVLNCDNIVGETAFMIGFYMGSCNYMDITGLRLTGLNQNPTVTPAVAVEGWRVDLCNHMTFTQCEFDHIQGPAVRVTQSTASANVIAFINCDSHHNGDPRNTGGGAYGNADGFDATGGTVTYTGCRAWWNSDDGFDCFYNDALVTYTNCWSFWNGYIPGTFTNPGSQADGMGYKWGIVTTIQDNTVRRKYIQCIAFQNKVSAFDQNQARCAAQFYNCTSYKNQVGWSNNNPPAQNNVIKNCVSYLDGTVISFSQGTVDHNSWQIATPISASFASLDTAGVTGARSNDGTLPVLAFLHLSATSNLIAKGIDVGLPFTPPAPDLGAYEVSGVVPPPVFTNITQSKGFTKNNCTSGAGSSVTYIVPAGKYSGSTQAAADQLALNDIAANGQNYANMNGTCIPKTIIKVVIYYSDGSQVIQQ